MLERCILIVDDDRSIRETLVDLFLFEGYDVESAADGVEALRKMRERRPAIVHKTINMDTLLEAVERHAAAS